VRSFRPRGSRRWLSRAVSLRSLVVVAVASAVLASGVGFAAALATTPKRLTVHAAADIVPVSTCTLRAEADTYADQGSSGSNFGAATTLHVRSAVTLILLADNKRSFVRFNVASCSIPATARITTARMKLFLSTAPAASRTYDVHRVTASWGETTLDWGNQPSVAGAATASVATGLTANVTLECDVLADVQGFVAGTLTNNGWRVKDRTESSGTAFEGRFNSDEHGTASQRPSLVITWYA
jgi:hypothetical protein